MDYLSILLYVCCGLSLNCQPVVYIDMDVFCTDICLIWRKLKFS